MRAQLLRRSKLGFVLDQTPGVEADAPAGVDEKNIKSASMSGTRRTPGRTAPLLSPARKPADRGNLRGWGTFDPVDYRLPSIEPQEIHKMSSVAQLRQQARVQSDAARKMTRACTLGRRLRSSLEPGLCGTGFEVPCIAALGSMRYCAA